MSNLSFKQKVGIFILFTASCTILGIIEGENVFTMPMSIITVIALMVYGPADNTKPTKRSKRNKYTPKV
jgi:hypothetical protein